MADTKEVTVRRSPFELIPRRGGRLLDWLFENEWPSPMGLTLSEALPVDISRANGDVIVRASMPGFDAKEISVEVKDGVLSISAEHKEESETKGEQYYRRERRVGTSSRMVALPEAVDESKVKAELKNGVLTITAPASEKKEGSKIEVQSS
jgi:HSP20 family protein